jgi:hypothetical protein
VAVQTGHDAIGLAFTGGVRAWHALGSPGRRRRGARAPRSRHHGGQAHRFNGGPRHDQATFWIDLPDGAVATGLRTHGTQAGKPKWFAGDLMEAEAAAAKYRELSGIGGYYPKDPALLSWRSQTPLALQVVPCPPGEEKAIEYTPKVPTRYEHGSRSLTLQRTGSENLEATLFVRAAQTADEVSIAVRVAPSCTLACSPVEERTCGGATTTTGTSTQDDAVANRCLERFAMGPRASRGFQRTLRGLAVFRGGLKVNRRCRRGRPPRSLLPASRNGTRRSRDTGLVRTRRCFAAWRLRRGLARIRR